MQFVFYYTYYTNYVAVYFTKRSHVFKDMFKGVSIISKTNIINQFIHPINCSFVIFLVYQHLYVLCITALHISYVSTTIIKIHIYRPYEQVCIYLTQFHMTCRECQNALILFCITLSYRCIFKGYVVCNNILFICVLYFLNLQAHSFIVIYSTSVVGKLVSCLVATFRGAYCYKKIMNALIKY